MGAVPGDVSSAQHGVRPLTERGVCPTCTSRGAGGSELFGCLGKVEGHSVETVQVLGGLLCWGHSEAGKAWCLSTDSQEGEEKPDQPSPSPGRCQPCSPLPSLPLLSPNHFLSQTKTALCLGRTLTGPGRGFRKIPCMTFLLRFEAAWKFFSITNSSRKEEKQALGCAQLPVHSLRQLPC